MVKKSKAEILQEKEESSFSDLKIGTYLYTGEFRLFSKNNVRLVVTRWEVIEKDKSHIHVENKYGDTQILYDTDFILWFPSKQSAETYFMGSLNILIRKEIGVYRGK